MNTKFTTGQAILIPATIRSAREENGVVIYDVNSNTWDGIPEDAIVIDENKAAQEAFNTGMRQLTREVRDRYY